MTVLQIFLGPLLVSLLVLGIMKIVERTNSQTSAVPPELPLNGIYKCTPGYGSKNPCITLMYSAEDPDFHSIIKIMSQINRARSKVDLLLDNSWTPSLTFLPKANIDIVGVPNEEFIYNFTDMNPNVTHWAVSFKKFASTEDLAVTNYQYKLWYNNTQTQRMYRSPGAPPFIFSLIEPYDDTIITMMRAVDEAIIAFLNGFDQNSPHFNVYLKDFPQIVQLGRDNCPKNPDATFNTLAPILLFIPSCIIFLTSIIMIVGDKEIMMKEFMEISGLMQPVFWLSHFISNCIPAILSSLVLCILGRSFGLSLFVNCDFGIIFLVYAMTSISGSAFSCFISSMISNVKLGVGLGYFIITLSTIYIGVGGTFTYAWYSDPNSPPETNLNPVWNVLIFFPFFNYNKLVRDIMTYTSISVSKNSTTCFLVPGTSFDASLLEVIPRYPIGPFSPGKGLEHLVPTPSQSFCFLFMNLIIFLVLAIYFDKIVPNSNGSCSHPLFFLFPSTYGFKSLNTTVNKTLDDFPDMKIQAENEDPDVSEERQECLKKNPEEVGLLIQSIHKRYLGGFQMFLSWLYSVFGKNYLFNAPEKRPAIHEVSFALEKGQLLSLLGSNGAGKTSLIKILSGSSPSTLGNAWIFGKSVYSQIDEVQKIIGICPQFDVLLKDLSAWEHIKLFCGIRGISDDKMKEIAKTRLEHMRLWKVKDQNAGQYSGGMKRRLSVILSTLGDPMCVFLDEPTTGMDPVNRRHVWTFLQKFKENRIVILTTHSMEEAEILGDKIAIMVGGRLKALGKSLRLKNKYGDGYKITVVVPQKNNVEFVKNEISKASQVAALETEDHIGVSDGKIGSETTKLTYALKNINSCQEIIKSLNLMQSGNLKEEPKISGWGLHQTTLEDVFFKMIKT